MTQALLFCGTKKPFSWLNHLNTQYEIPAICVSYGGESFAITKRDYVLSYQEWRLAFPNGKIIQVKPIFHSPSHNLIMFKLNDNFDTIEKMTVSAKSKVKINTLSYNNRKLMIAQAIMTVKKTIYTKKGMEDENIYVDLESVGQINNIIGCGVFYQSLHNQSLMGIIMYEDTRQQHYLMMPVNNIIHFIKLYKSKIDIFQIVYPSTQITSFNGLSVVKNEVNHPDFGCSIPVKFLFWYHAFEQIFITVKNENQSQEYYTTNDQTIYPYTSLPLHLSINWTLIPYNIIGDEIIVTLTGDLLMSMVDCDILDNCRSNRLFDEILNGLRFDRKRIAFHNSMRSFRIID